MRPGETQRTLRDALQGGEAAREDLLERLRPRIVLWVSTRLSPELRARVDPEDIAQEVLLGLHKGLDEFEDKGEGAFFGWMFRMAENRIRDVVDYHGAKKRQPAARAEQSQTSPSTAAARSEAFAQVQQVLSGLQEDYRRVIQLRRLEELEVPEVARLMERSENAVRVLYCRALQALRQAMEA